MTNTKRSSSTDNYTHCDMMLFRRRPYCRFVQLAHYACRTTTKAAVRILSALNLKGRLKKKVRDRSVSAEQSSPLPAESSEGEHERNISSLTRKR